MSTQTTIPGVSPPPVTEAQVLAEIRRYLARVGGWECKTWGNPMMRRGTPDLLCCVCGCFVGIEVKRPGGKPTPEQLAELERIEHAGGLGIVATSVEDVRRAVAPLLTGRAR